MRKYNTLAIITLIGVLHSCGDGKKNKESLFSIDDSQFKVMYHSDESVSLALTNPKNKTIDSVVYQINDKKIGSVKSNKKFDYALSKEKFGEHSLKATAYFEGDKIDTETKLTLVSSIEPKLLNYKIVNTYPHNSDAFTEGLEFHGDYLYESTGSGGNYKSFIRKMDYKTGKVLQQVDLDPKYFGEGITILKNKIFQLTWENKTGFIYDLNTMKLEKTFKYDKDIEGWGMTNDGENIYHNDKTERIWKMNPETQKMIDYVNVYSNSTKIESINELEWIEGKIYANVWQKDIIIIINPNNGAVESVIDMKDLRTKVTNKEAEVLNGIAYNPKTKTIFVTGKNWDKMFEIKIIN
jgi:glutaminyl-peptide cyclotransferase